MRLRVSSLLYPALLLSFGSPTVNAAELEEIITTAERRVADVQDVPLAVTTFTSDDLQSRQITGTLDLIQNVPNMSGSANVSLGGSNSYFLRGIGNAESIATFDVPVGTYIDEIYISRQNQNQIKLFDVANLEVLRGPQGTLFGRNTTGGAIVVVSEKPNEDFSVDVEGSAGSYDRYWLRGKVNVPFTDTFFGQFNVYGVDEDGWMDSVTTGESYNGEESWGVRGATRWVPSEAFTWDLSVQYSDTSLQAIGTAASTNAPINNPPPITGDLTKNLTALGDCEGAKSATAGLSVPDCSFNRMESLLIASNIGWDVGPFTLNFITGYYDLEQNYAADFFDNSSIPFGGILGDTFIIANNGQHEQISQEIKITGDFGDGTVNYVGGLFYMDEDNTTVFTDWVGTKPALFPLNIRTPLENTTQSFAAYTQFDWNVTDRLGLQAGGRWTDEEKDIDISGTLGVVNPISNADLIAIGIPTKQTEDKFTYKLGIDYQFTDDIMAYATYTTGFKSGGWNARGSSAAELADFGPEDVVSYEAGMRSEWLDNRVRANLTIFRAEYDDIQIATVEPNPDPNAPSLFITTNAGDSRIDGLELEMVVAATDNLRIYGNLGLMDGEYTRLSQGGQLAGIGPDPTRTPDATANIGADYIVPNVLNGELFFNANISWVDDYFMGNDNNPNTLIEEHTLVNGQAGWRNETWQAVVECKNCFDEEWFGVNLFDTLYTQDPFRWGIRLKYSYQ